MSKKQLPLSVFTDLHQPDNPVPGFGQVFNAGEVSDDVEKYDPALVTVALHLEGYTRETMLRLSPMKQRRVVRRVIARLRSGDMLARASGKPSMSEDRRASPFFDEMRRWFAGALTIEKPVGASLHHLIDYDMTYHVTSIIKETHKQIDWDAVQSIVVEHDWARVVGDKPEAATGAWRLPFEFCCFEFRVSGARVLAIATQEEGDDAVKIPIVAVGLARHWIVSPFEYDVRGTDVRRLPSRAEDPTNCEKINDYVDGKYDEIGRYVIKQVRAVSIILDAHVAETHAVAPGHGLNRARTRSGRSTNGGHHVVRLLRRSGAGQRRGEGTGIGSRRGLHFRRGHWRHYSNPDAGEIVYVNDGGFFLSKDWINWMMVGDPNVGIVEKEYRL